MFHYSQMKTIKRINSKELDVDFIGGQGPLTKSEEKAISEFIKSRKLLQAKKQRNKVRTVARIRLGA